MNKKTKIALSSILITLILLVIFLIIYVLLNIDNETKIQSPANNDIPVIKEDFNEVNLKLLKEYNGNIYVDGNDIIENDTDSYYIGILGKLYTSKIKINKKDEVTDIKVKNYTIKKTSDNFYYFVNGDIRSNLYDEINPICFINNSSNELCNYFLLNDKGSYQIYSLIDNDYVVLDYSIKSINYSKTFNGKIYLYENAYLPFNKSDRTILVDLDGNIKYDNENINIELLSENYYKIKVDNKYGVIDSDGEIILLPDNDYLSYKDGFYVVIRNNRIGVFNSNFKPIVNYEIPVVIGKDSYSFDYEIFDGLMYLRTYKYNNKGNDKIYIINYKGISRSQNGKYIYLTNKNKLLYIYDVVINNNTLSIHYYDEDLYEYYNYKENLTPSMDVKLTSDFKDKRYHILFIDYNDNSYDKTVYVDLFNSRIANEIDVNYKYFDNGYGYVLNNGKLSIYKKKELINSFDNINYYLGGYLFSSDNKVMKVEFKNDSN